MRTLPRWQQPLLGLSRFPKGLTDFEIEHFFSFSAEELRLIATRRVHLRIGAAVHLGFIKMTGTTLDAGEHIPLRLLFHLSALLRAQHIEIATPRSLYPRRRTLYHHQRWAMDVLDYHAFTDGRRRTLVRELRKHLAEFALSVDDTVELAKRWLYQRSILIPAHRSLRALTVRVQRASERDVQVRLSDHIPERIIDDWLSEMLRRFDEVPTALEWLQRTPRGRSQTSLYAALSRIDFLRRLAVHHYPPKHLTWSQQCFHAHRLRQRRPARLRAVPRDRRNLELACYLHVTLVENCDRAITLFDFQATDLRRKAFHRAQHPQRDERMREALIELQRLSEDTTIDDAQFRERFQAVPPKYSSELIVLPFSEECG